MLISAKVTENRGLSLRNAAKKKSTNYILVYDSWEKSVRNSRYLNLSNEIDGKKKWEKLKTEFRWIG